MPPNDERPDEDPGLEPASMDWRYQLDFFHVHGMDGVSTSLVSLKDRDGMTARAKGEGQTPLHALINALSKITGRRYTLRCAKIYATRNEFGARAQSHIVLVDEQSSGSAGFGWATSEHDAFMIAALRIVNAHEAEQQAEAITDAKGYTDYGWRKSRRAASQLAA